MIVVPRARPLEFWRRVPLSVAPTIVLAAVAGLLAAVLGSVALVALAVAAIVALFFAWPWRSLLVLLLVRPLLDSEGLSALVRLPGDLTPGGVVGVGITAIGIAFIVAKPVRIDRQPVSLAFLGFLVVSSLTTIFATYDRGSGLYDLARVLSIWVLYVLLTDQLRTHQRMRSLATVLLVSSVVPVAVGWYQLINGSGYSFEGFTRIQGTFVWSNSYARFLCMQAILGSVLYFHLTSRRSRFALGAYLLALSVAFVSTYARASWLSLGAGMLVIAIVGRRVALVGAVALAILLPSAVPAVATRFSDLSTGSNSLIDRQVNWETALADYSDNPLPVQMLGAGWGYLGTEGLLAAGRADLPVHNDYVRLLVETGALGLFLYLVAMLLVARQAYRTYVESPEGGIVRAMCLVLLGAWAARMLVSASDSSVLASPATEYYFWSIAAIAQAARTMGVRTREPARST